MRTVRLTEVRLPSILLQRILIPGTWTKKSVCVGPRTPFGQDPTIDYAYDSDAEWVDDEGDNVDAGDAADSEEDEEDDEDGESEGEFDDWLDDSKDAVKKKIGKRKITEIVPTWAGPLWEDKLGAGTPGMEDYRIRCLNGELVSAL
jgi:chromatin assembly factor 1 subunit A